jgi:hypothetical protein
MSVRLRALVGVYGASKFLAAALAGDLADDATIDARRAVCRDCPNRVRKIAPGSVAESDWCGEPLVETGSTCGCLIAGKTLVGSETCPSGKW